MEFDVPLRKSHRDDISPFERRINEDSTLFRSLTDAKASYGSSSAVETKFQHNRTAFGQPSQLFMRQFSASFDIINRHVNGLFDNNQVKRFLDLGCAPGGFSKWLLEHNSDAFGVGVTLPADKSRVDMDVRGTPMENLERYKLEYADVTQIDQSTALLSSAAPYNLIIAGAFPTGQQVPVHIRQGLLLSQLLHIISHLEDGGSSVIVVNTKPRTWIAEVVEMLCSLFSSVNAVKSKELHATRSSCYLICTGFHAVSEKIPIYMQQIRMVLDSTHEISLDDNGERCLCSSESWAELYTRAHAHMLELFEPIWKIQLEAIASEMRHFQVSINYCCSISLFTYKSHSQNHNASPANLSQNWRSKTGGHPHRNAFKDGPITWGRRSTRVSN